MSGFFSVKFGKSTYAVIGVLAAVFLIIGGMDAQIKKSRAKAKSLGTQPRSLDVVTVELASSHETRTTELKWGADPFADKFRIAVSGPEGESDTEEEVEEESVIAPKLQGIVSGPQGEMALLDGELMTIGDTVNGIRLLQIGDDYVVISQRGIRMRLALQPR